MVSLSETDLHKSSEPSLSLSPEMREFMGIHPVQFHIAGEPHSPLQEYFLEQVANQVIRDGGGEHSDTKDVNTIFFPSPLTEEVPGMFGYKSEFHRGVAGVAFASIPEMQDGVNLLDLAWTMLGRAGTQYGILAVGDSEVNRRPLGAFVFSMEGAKPFVDFQLLGEEEGFRDVAARITHLAGGQKASQWEVDRTMPDNVRADTTHPDEIIETGKRLRAMGLLPHVRLEEYVSGRREREIRLLLEVSGLTIGNFSSWDSENEVMWITGSGFDKGNLTPDQIVAIRDFRPALDGTVVWATEGAERVKPSVEAIDQLFVNAAIAALSSGLLKEPDLRKFIPLVSENGSDGILAEGSHENLSMIHIHLHPKQGSWNPDFFHVVDVDPRLVPRGAYHSSCGTLPLALYGTEAIMRGTREADGKIVIARWPNHGIQIASPYTLLETVDMIDPANGQIKFTDVPPV